MKIMYSIFFVIAAFCIFEMSAHHGGSDLVLSSLLGDNAMDLPNTIPLGHDGAPVSVDFSIFLVNIADVDTKNKEVVIDAWLGLKWNTSVKWAPKQFSGVENVAVPREAMWVPDISVYNSVGKLSADGPDLVTLHHTGQAMWMPQRRIRGLCGVDAHALASKATCTFTFGLWANSDKIANLTEGESGIVNKDYYFADSRFEVLEISSVRSLLEFPCCPGGSYSNFQVSFSFKEKIATHPMNGFVQGMFSSCH